ncbi:MAG: Rne/Rng family ribonuclease [Pseudoscardovia radai]|nr:Rne/Rng family ribonuclease [Pseudoscardovia radai]
MSTTDSNDIVPSPIPAGASESASDQPASVAPRRRSRSRRVVRGAGAAAASAGPVVVRVGEPAGDPDPNPAPAPSPEPQSPESQDDSKEQTTRKRTRSRRRKADAADAEAARRTRIGKLASEIFVDPGIPAPQETERVENARNAESDDSADASREAASRESDDDSATTRTRTRTRRRRAAIDDAPTPSRARAASAQADDSDDSDDEPSARARRARRAVSQILEFSNPEGSAHQGARESRSRGDKPQHPMMSLLFQEPVLPAHGPAAAENRDRRSDSEDADETRTGLRTRRRSRSSSSEDREDASWRGSRRSRSARDERDERDDRDNRDTRDERDAEDFETTRSGRSRRSRRLNAQERRAAAEVEQIEEDLRYDDIDYRPVEDDAEGAGSSRRHGDSTDSGRDSDRDSGRASRDSRDSDSDADGTTRTRRRRRRHEAEESAEEPAEETTVTRRRRRRRGAKAEEEKAAIPRSRKQQYIDEITDIEGSTRLEAKKQRRRDNRRDRSRQSLITEQDFLARRESVNRLMVVREKERHTQISVIEDNTLVEHYISDIQEVSAVGNIYLGRVQNVLPSMEAAFVDIGQARNGVLYAGEVNWDTTRLEGQPRRIELAFKSGDPVLVQVTKDPIGHKGARLTSQVTLAGRFLVLVPSGGMTGVSRKLPAHERARLKSIVSKIAPKDMGVIIRTAAEGAPEEAIVKDLQHLQKQWDDITAKQKEYQHSRKPHLLQGEPDVAIRVVRDIFNDDFSKLVVEGDRVYDRIRQYLESTAPDLLDRLEKWNPEDHNGKDAFDKWSIDSQLRKGMERKVYLPSGGSLVIDRTEAMTTIDVNTGRFIGKGKSLEETVTRCNLEAAEEIVRQLRLRDIGGMIMIDFVDMVLPQNRDLVLRRLVECLSRDRTKHQVAEVTSLGLVQMTRKRVGQGLVEAFSEECPTCKGRGFILHDKPIVSASYDDPYALKGGDPFVKTNKHKHGTQIPERELQPGSTPSVKAKLARIAAAAQAAADSRDER